MKQAGIIQRVIKSVVLYYYMPKGTFMPSQYKHLVKDHNGEPQIGMFSYSSVVGMLLYFSCNTSPYASLYVNSCSQYMFSPRFSR